MNHRKNKLCKSVWIDENELKELINAIDGNYQSEAFRIIFEIYKRGDFLV